jgi:hypothetical protein
LLPPRQLRSLPRKKRQAAEAKQPARKMKRRKKVAADKRVEAHGDNDSDDDRPLVQYQRVKGNADEANEHEGTSSSSAGTHKKGKGAGKDKSKSIRKGTAETEALPKIRQGKTKQHAKAKQVRSGPVTDPVLRRPAVRDTPTMPSLLSERVRAQRTIDVD